MAPLPSWEEIETQAAAAGYPASRRRGELFRAANRPRAQGGGGCGLQLWRDSFGWCPFSQQAQLHLEEKGVAYQVRKVPLTLYRVGDRDEEFLRDSPEGMVPALRVLGEGQEPAPPAPAVGSVAVGAAGVRAFIEDHCEGPPLLRCAGVSHCMVKAYLDLAGSLERQLHALVGAAASAERCEEVAAAERFLLATLEDIDLALSEIEDGPYFFGSTFTVVDIAFAPWVDRAAALLGWLCNRSVRGGLFPALDGWLAAMEARPAHRNLRLDDETIVRIAVASQPALATGQPSLSVTSAAASAVCGAEAAQCLAACRAGVAALAARRAPKASPHALDGLLRAAAAGALGEAGGGLPSDLAGSDAAEDLAAAAIFVRSRLAVPRDMSAEAARSLRRSLEAVAEACVGLERADALLSKELDAYGEKVTFLSRY